MKKYHVVIFVNGCFWHLHGCSNSVIPSTNTQFWKNKLGENVVRDKMNLQKLEDAGWRVITVWECDIRARFEETMERMEADVKVII